MAFKLVVTTLTISTFNLCLSAYSEVNNTFININTLSDIDSAINTKYKKYASHDNDITFPEFKDNPKINYLRQIRSLNASIDEVTDIKKENITNTINKEDSKLDLNDKDKMVANRTATDEEITTEYFETSNFTEEPCIGDPEYCNMTREEYLDMLNDYIFPHPHEWVLIATHAIVFVIGLIGNALVCVAVYRNHSMRTVTNYFIVNLAVADFMVILICLPPTVLWDVTETWFFGTAMCRIVLYFQSVSVTVSVLTLTFISVDRWYAICFPLKFKSTTNRAKTAILIIWVLSLLFNIPEFVVLQVKKNMELRFNVQYFMQCTPTWSDESDLKWHIIKALFLYTFPLLLMMIAYCQIVRVLWRSDNIPGHTESHKLCPASGQTNWLAANRRTTPSIHANASTEGQLRSRRKAAKMLVAVVIMFAVCYFPVHLLSVLRVAYEVQQSEVMTCIALISHVMCYANSAVNPLIYNFMSGKFRREFHRSYFKCFCCCHTAAPEQNGLAANRRTTPSIHANASTEGQLRSRRKAAKMLVAVVIMFAVCYFPVHLLSVLRVAYEVQQSEVMTCIALISHVMCYANSAVNPLIYNFMSGKFRREFHRSYFKCFCCCHTAAPEQNGTSFAPIGSSRAGTTRTIVRRNDSCVSYRLTHLSPSNHNSINRDMARNTNTSFIDHMNGNRRNKSRDESISESARYTLATDIRD